MPRWFLIAAWLLCSGFGAFVGGAGDGSTALPTEVTGLQLWLEADAGCINGSSVSCVDGDAVATWQDQSGTAHHGTVASPCTQGPTYKANIRNGHPALLFDGVTAAQCFKHTYTGDPGTIIVVYYQKANTFGQAQALLGADTSDAVAVGAYQMEPYGINGYGYRNFQRLTTADSTNAAPAVWHTADSHVLRLWDIWSVQNDGATLTSLKSEFTASTNAKPANTARPINTAIIGSEFYSSVVVSPFNGYIAEVIMFDNAISTTNRTKVLNYVKAKYDLVPKGDYLMAVTQGGVGPGSFGCEICLYGDQSPYILRGPDGIHWPYVQPTNFTMAAGPGKNVFGTLQFSLLRDQTGNLIKSDGRYWAEFSRNTLWQADTPLTTYKVVDVASSLDLFQWDYEASYTYTAGRLVNNDGWFQNPADSKIYIKFNDSQNGAQTDNTSHWIETTSLLHGNVVFSASDNQLAGSAIAPGFDSYTNKSGATYYTIWNRTDLGTNQAQIANSTSPFTGYNSSSTITSAGTHREWGQLIQNPTTSKWLMIQDHEGAGLEYQTVDDPSLANPTGFAAMPNPTTGATSFVPQGPSIAYTPAGL